MVDLHGRARGRLYQAEKMDASVGTKQAPVLFPENEAYNANYLNKHFKIGSLKIFKK